MTERHVAPTADDRILSYRTSLGQARGEAGQLRSRSTTLGWVRLSVFGAIVITGIYASVGRQPALWLIPALLFIVFLILVRVHARVRSQLDHADALVVLHENRIAAAIGELQKLPRIVAIRRDLPHWASELDIVGDISLLRLLGGATTVLGHRTLERWLFTPAKPAEISERQASVRELSDRIRIVDDLQTSAILSPAWPHSALLPFVQWGEKREAGPGLTRITWWARLVTASVLLSGLLYGTGAIPSRPFVIVLLISIATAGLFAWRATRAISAAQGKEGPLQSFSTMLRTIETTQFTSPGLIALQSRLREGDVTASATLDSLRRIMALAEIRYSPMMHAPLQLAVLWDIHIHARLENWRVAHGHRIAGWLDVLGETEALCALASLHHANPDWSFPNVVVARPNNDGNSAAGEDSITCRDLAHPLIPRGIRVGNDVTVGPPGSFLLVTGSNMSGKSTLLRAIGVNTVLAQMGAPVCSPSMRMPSVRLATSIQVQDSLAQGISRFMAELLRIREVVEIVRTSPPEEGVLPLYLLDEMLQGTNSAERQAGARMIINRLLHSRCIGIVTTHDLSLADSPELSRSSHKVHFSEGVEERDGKIVLSFEYKLRDGIATSVNALRLMRAVGLGGDEETNIARRD